MFFFFEKEMMTRDPKLGWSRCHNNNGAVTVLRIFFLAIVAMAIVHLEMCSVLVV
jgi:hypothetical protein